MLKSLLPLSLRNAKLKGSPLLGARGGRPRRMSGTAETMSSSAKSGKPPATLGTFDGVVGRRAPKLRCAAAAPAAAD